MLNLDIALVGNFCGIYTCTEGCWMAGDHWTNLSHIIASFCQWHSTSWGLLLTSDLIKILLIILWFFWWWIVWRQDSADKKFGNVDGYRIYKKRTRLIYLLNVIYLFGLWLSRNVSSPSAMSRLLLFCH